MNNARPEAVLGDLQNPISRRDFLKLSGEALRGVILYPTLLQIMKLAGIVSTAGVLSSCSVDGAPTQDGSENNTEPIAFGISPEDRELNLMLQQVVPSTDIIDCSQLSGPGQAPSEAEAFQILQESGCQIPEDTNTIWEEVVNAPQIASLTTLALPSLAIPGPIDDLILAGLIALEAGTIVYLALNKKNAPTSTSHSDTRHDPYHPNGGPARNIIDQITKGGVTAYCFTVKLVNSQGVEVVRTIVTTGVLNNPYLTLMAWFNNINPANKWGGAYMYPGHPEDLKKLVDSSQYIVEAAASVCPDQFPSGVKYP